MDNQCSQSPGEQTDQSLLLTMLLQEVIDDPVKSGFVLLKNGTWSSPGGTRGLPVCHACQTVLLLVSITIKKLIFKLNFIQSIYIYLYFYISE